MAVHIACHYFLSTLRKLFNGITILFGQQKTQLPRPKTRLGYRLASLPARRQGRWNGCHWPHDHDGSTSSGAFRLAATSRATTSSLGEVRWQVFSLTPNLKPPTDWLEGSAAAARTVPSAPAMRATSSSAEADGAAASSACSSQKR
jgi:hypothetical protein